VSLGFQAGADLIDLEMQQYYPAVFAYPESVKGVLIQYETFLEKQYLDFRLVNKEGEEFLPEGPLPVRDTLMRLILREIEKGRGTEHSGVYIDPRRSSKGPEEIDELIHELLKVPDRNLKNLGIDIRKDRIEVCPAVHHTLGGIHINEKTETSVQGLFAAGENGGNVHGADRISGNALSETQVFGARAGKYAAGYSRGKRHNPLPSKEIRKGIQEWKGFLEKKEVGIRPLILRKELKRVMDRYLGPNRDEAGMKEAIQRIFDLKQNALPRVEVVGGCVFNVDWRMAVEVSMTLDLAELVVRSAVMRKETRGHHFRQDFPETSDVPQHTLVRKRGQKVEMVYTPVRKHTL
jgi:fumarate reductase (CoM/CoB) subunit A